MATPDGLLTVPPAEETFAAANDAGRRDRDRPVRRARTAGPPWTTCERNADRLNARLPQQAAEYGLQGRLPQPRPRVHHQDRRPLRCSRCSPTCSTRRCSWRSTSTGRPPVAADPVELAPSPRGPGGAPCTSKDGPMRPGISARELPSDQQPAGQRRRTAGRRADRRRPLSIPYAVHRVRPLRGRHLRWHHRELPLPEIDPVVSQQLS